MELTVNFDIQVQSIMPRYGPIYYKAHLTLYRTRITLLYKYKSKYTARKAAIRLCKRSVKGSKE